MDTFGGNVLKLAAVQEFTKVLMWKLQLYAKSGRMGELSKQFPELFPPEVTKETLRTAHLNSIEVAKRGVDAELQTPNGGKETACHQFSRLLSFVNEPISDPGQNIEYTGLSKGIINELVKVHGFHREKTMKTIQMMIGSSLYQDFTRVESELYHIG